MARLSGLEIEEIQADLTKAAEDYSEKYGVIIVLKDAATVVVRKDEPIYINSSGCAAMLRPVQGTC